MIMDMTTQIKKSLISRIKDSNDMNFLKALQTIFDSSEQSLYQLSPEQQDSINEGREDIKNGNYIDNDQLMSEMKEWLTKK
jgi:predicted transcriptional regulator